MNKIDKFIKHLSCSFLLFASVDLYAQEYDEYGVCPEGFEMPDREGREEVFTIVGQPILYVGGFDDTAIDLSVTAAMSMQTQMIKISGNVELDDRVEVVSRRKILDDRRVCGWISTEDVLEKSAKPLKVDTPIDWTDPVTGKTKTIGNPLSLKALLRSNPEFESDATTEVAIYDKPDIAASERTTASVFGIYKIYAERELESGVWYWIAGEEPHRPTKFAGWIPDHHVLLWESQLSLYFNETTENAYIFAERNQAATTDTSGVLGERPVDFKERSIGVNADETGEINIARFPILEEVHSAAGRGKTIYKIGFFGDGGGGGVSGSEGEALSERAKFQQKVENVDILFLLDNTLSMTEYFNSVVQAVRNSSSQINRINEDNGYKIKVKFAAAIYGDYADDAADIDNLQFKVVSRLGRPGVVTHLEKLSDLAADPDSYYRDALGDRPEAGLAGLVRGIEDLQWTSNSLFKVVVWIGDHGSREYGDRENISVAEVQQVVADNNVFLLPINVAGRYDEEWNFQFIRQGDQITDGAGLGLRTLLAHDGVQTDDYDTARENIEQSIATMYASSLLANTALRNDDDIDQTLSERPDLLQLDLPVAQSDVLKISKSICQLAFGSKGCESIKKKGQFMGEGFVNYDTGQKNFNFWVNLTQEQLELVEAVLRNTCRGFDRGNIKRYVEQAMTQVQNAMGGDNYRSDVPVGEYLRRFFLLPRGHFPSFLESTPERIEEAWEEARDIDSDNGNLALTTAIADPICRSATLLDLVLQQKRVIKPNTDVVRTASITGTESYSWSVADESSLIAFDWEWAQGGENNYYYIPVDFLPGRVPVQ